jgi:transcriptional regulator with XRE-family HTH domain
MSRHADDMKRRIAGHLIVAMNEQGVSSAELARRLGLNEKTVRRWRGAEVMPDPERLAQAADVLGLELGAFYLPPDTAAEAA